MRSLSALLADMTSCTSTALAAMSRIASTGQPLGRLFTIFVIATSLPSTPTQTTGQRQLRTLGQRGQTSLACTLGMCVAMAMAMLWAGLCHLPRIDGWLDMLWPSRQQQSR